MLLLTLFLLAADEVVPDDRVPVADLTTPDLAKAWETAPADAMAVSLRCASGPAQLRLDAHGDVAAWDDAAVEDFFTSLRHSLDVPLGEVRRATWHDVEVALLPAGDQALWLAVLRRDDLVITASGAGPLTADPCRTERALVRAVTSLHRG